MFELMRAISIDAAGGRAEGRAEVPADHPMLVDHFPGSPVMPGSLLLELAAQTAGPLAEEITRIGHGLDRWAMLGMIREAKFLNPIPLPAEIILFAEAVRSEPSSVTLKVAARAHDQQALRAELTMMMVEASTQWAEAIRARHARLARWTRAV
jgi:3-hydroxymyristoyl/3-hydroxydecanoyl-(acyl carrier protein) dehydratase